MVELMVVVAILTVIAAIAIPAYNGYIAEAHYSAARANADSLRIFMEDHFLDNGTYVASGTSPATYDKTQLNTDFNWNPTGDQDAYSYSVTATTSSWDIDVQHTAAGYWMHCDSRMSACCYGSTGSPPSVCP